MKIWFFLLPLFSWASPLCLFTPPNGWQPVQPKNLSECIQIGFIAKGSDGFHSSINLAIEEVDCSMKEYLKAVKEIHLSQANTQWRDLGKIDMKAGTGRLTEVSCPSPFGQILMMQAILIKEKMAYILTAAVLKKDFLALQKEILASLKSLDLTSDLWSFLQEPLKEKFLSLIHNPGDPESRWKSLQTLLSSETSSLGPYWQLLALKEGREKIYSGPK